MDSLMQLWEFAPALKTKWLFLAVIGQMLIAIYGYSVMSKARVAAVRAKRVSPDDYKANRDEPEDLRVFTQAVANHFELPVLFYALVLLFVVASAQSWVTVVLAWLFVTLPFFSYSRNDRPESRYFAAQTVHSCHPDTVAHDV
jgi:hypothetical protein